MAAGTATITATVGGVKATVAVTVLPPIVSVMGISLSKTSATIASGKTLTLTATITPSDATNKNVVWSSSKESVATVSQNGVVTAKNISADATVTITASPEDNPSLAATCEIKVVANAVAITKLELTNPGTIYIGQVLELTPTITPSNASIESIEWTVSQGAPFMAQAIGDGKKGRITGMKTGYGTLTVKVTDVLGTTKTRSLQITVQTNSVASVTLNQKSLTLKAGESYGGLVATVKGVSATVPPSNGNISWTSSNTAVATVDSNVDGSNKSDSCIVTVIATDPGNGGNEGVDFDDWNF